MIQLGMTDCPVVRELLDKDQLELDYLEVHGPYVESARKAYPEIPMVLHNALYQWSLTHRDGLHHKYAADLTLERLEIARSPWYSLHLGFSAEEVDFYEDGMQAISPLQTREEVLSLCIDRIQQLSTFLPIPVLIENMDYNPTNAYEYVCEPGFISEVLIKTDTGLLFDQAHARVTAHAMGITVEEYIDQLPMERVRQVHLNKPGWKNGRMMDTHQALTEEDYQLFAKILKMCQPWAVTLEYNLDPEKTLIQITRLREIIQNSI